MVPELCVVVRLVVLFAACSAESVPTPTTLTATTTTRRTTTAPLATTGVVSTPPVVTSNGPEPIRATTTTNTAAVRERWFVVWVTGLIPAEFSSELRLTPGVNVVSEVWVGNAHVVETRSAAGDIVDDTAPGFVLPLELHAIDPVAHSGFAPADVADAFAGLAGDEVLLGATSARLRRLGRGATVTLEGGEVLTVAGVVADKWVGFAEIVTTSPDRADMGADRPRYAVVQFDGSAGRLQEAAALLTDQPIRVWAEGDVPVFRHADAVRPQVEMKERFGEFAYRPLGGQRVEIEPDWVDANIVIVNLPRIGIIRCHRDFADLLRGVMDQLESNGDGRIITPASDVGCFNARFIAGRRGPVPALVGNGGRHQLG